MRISSAIATILAAALLVAACGGDGDDREPSNPDDPVTQAYIAEANARCLELAPALQRQDRGYDLQTEEGFEQFIDEVAIPELQQMIDDLREMEPPPGDEETVAAIYDEYEAAVDQAREQELGEVEPTLYDEANTRAVAYGLNECVQQG